MASVLDTEQGGKPTDPSINGNKKEEEDKAENEKDEKKSISVDIDSPNSLQSEHDMLMDQRWTVKRLNSTRLNLLSLYNKQLIRYFWNAKTAHLTMNTTLATGFSNKNPRTRVVPIIEKTLLQNPLILQKTVTCALEE